MALNLGKSLDRCYNLKIPFLNGFYNIGVFFNKKSTFLLFSADEYKDFSEKAIGRKLLMFKNLKTSKFCETFLNLYSFKSDRLDIHDQFNSIKEEYIGHINYILNETIILSKINIEGKDIFDSLSLYGFTISSYSQEYIFLIAERQNINKKINRKIVRTTGIQIATTQALGILDEFFHQGKNINTFHETPFIDPNEIIKIS